MKDKNLRIVILVIIAVLLTHYGLKLYQAPLETYTWTELLINYAAGFIRRGLIGKIAYWISPYLSVKFFLSASITLCYLIHLILYSQIAKKIETFEWALFALSPAAFLFPVYDFDAFGRKDVFLILIFMISFLLILKNVKLTITLPAILSLYQIGVLIHEYALFYFPFAIFLILVCYRKAPSRQLIFIAAAGVLFMLVNLYGLYAFSRRYYNLDLIAESWVGLIKDYDLTPQSGAFGWMGIPLKDGLQPVFDKLSYPRTFFSYIAGMALALIPSILLNARYRILDTLREEYQSAPWKLYAFGLILLVSLPVFMFGSDWGRLTNLFSINIFLSLVVLRESFQSENTAEVSAAGSHFYRTAAILMVVLYAFTWHIKHYVDGDHIALQQGLLFQIFHWL